MLPSTRPNKFFLLFPPLPPAIRPEAVGPQKPKTVCEFVALICKSPDGLFSLMEFIILKQLNLTKINNSLL